jgi:ParB/RepB/Spo0J family partition protein
VSRASFAHEYREIPIACLRAPSLPARTRIDEEKLESLTRRIREHGFQSVIGVFPVDEAFEVVFGHRRLLAATRAGVAALPCFVYATRDAGLEALKYTENAEREQMRPTEEAIYFSELLERDCGGDTTTLAAQLSLTRDYVERRLLLFSGHREVFEALDTEQIGIGVAEQINKCDDPQHARFLLHEAIAFAWSVGFAAQQVHQWKVLRDFQTSAPAAPAAGSLAARPVADPYFTCKVCGLTEHPDRMRPVQIHEYCLEASLLPALELFTRRHEFTRWPRTHDEAIALIEELARRFPSLTATPTEAA